MPATKKRTPKETSVVGSILLLLEEKGFMDLKILKVVKYTQLSMRAVYSHFSCKENPLPSHTIHVSKNSASVFDQLTKNNAPPVDRLLTLNISIWLYDAQQPYHYFLRQQVMIPDIWQHESTELANILNNAYQATSQLVDTLIMELMDENLEHVLTRYSGSGLIPDQYVCFLVKTILPAKRQQISSINFYPGQTHEDRD